MNKNEKNKTTCKAKKRIYVRQISDQGSLSSGTFRLKAEKLRFSEVNFYHDPVNDLLKKKVHDKIPLIYDEELKLGSMLKLFKGFECENDKAVCKYGSCLFAGNPDDWVKYRKYDNLCDLVYDYIKFGSKLNPLKCDAMSISFGNGFCNQ